MIDKNNFFFVQKPVFLCGLFLLVFYPSFFFPQTNYNLIYDKNLTAITAAEDIITLHKIIHTAENKFFHPILFSEKTWYLKTTEIFYRATKTAFIDFPIDYTLFLIQHEVFGHGSKFRQFDYEKNSYNITLPPPYGKGSGFAQIGQWKYSKYGINRSTSFHEYSAIYYGGIEANTILAKKISNKWLSENQTINSSESFLYLLNFHSITRYISKTRETNNYISSSNDILNYLYFLNSQNGYIPTENFPFHLTDLKKQLIFYSIDPFQYFAAFAYIKYLWSGNETMLIPMIPLGKIKYLPSFHIGLTPFGTQLNFENYFVLRDKILSLQYSYGDKTFYKFWNQKIELNNIINKKYFSYGTAIHFWQQPSIELGGGTSIKSKGGNGGAIYNTIIFKTVTENLPVNIYLQLLYKTEGFLEGEKLDKGFNTRAGFSFYF